MSNCDHNDDHLMDTVTYSWPSIIRITLICIPLLIRMHKFCWLWIHTCEFHINIITIVHYLNHLHVSLVCSLIWTPGTGLFWIKWGSLLDSHHSILWGSTVFTPFHSSWVVVMLNEGLAHIVSRARKNCGKLIVKFAMVLIETYM